ncbi:hypothetical protein CK203_060690 [Vitis vinifera]|uniref:Uncharacterized protein n=1 Tax=Vitis vinifera TaxID=29760 RepID=A0A438GA88_VITVI|nr:hypothetical protein CK203_060690 [Vitis vinifera]
MTRFCTNYALQELIYFMTADRAMCIMFFDDDLPPKGSNHVQPLFIDVAIQAAGHLHRPSELIMGLSRQLWIHEAGAIPSSLHQKVKFIHEGRIITIQSDRDVVTSSEPVLQISHSEDDLHLTGFTFDEVQVVSLGDDSRDMVPMSFDHYSSTLVLNMMRGMSYLSGLGLGRRQHGPREFTFIVDYDIPYGLGYTPTKEDARYMLTDYFVRGSDHAPHMEGIVCISEAVEVVFSIQSHTVPHFDFDLFGVSVIDTDDVTLYDACTNEMDMIGTGHILDAASHGPRSVLDMFGAFMHEIG